MASFYFLNASFPFNPSFTIWPFLFYYKPYSANTLDAIQSSNHDVRGPGNVHNSFISVANGQTIRVSAVGIHNSGRPFANSSSMYLDWDLTGCDHLSHWDENANVANSVTSWERFLSLHNESGMVWNEI